VPPITDRTFDALRDMILRGVAHALSNRVAALGSINGVIDPGQVWTEKMGQLLQGESRKLEDILRLLRLLPDDDRIAPGAIELQPLIPDVVALHAFNSSLLQVECAVEYNREVMPIYASRPRLVHTLLLIIDAAKRHVQPSGGRVAIRYAGDADKVTIRIAGEPSAAAAVKAGTAAPPPRDASVTLPATELALRAAIASIGNDPEMKVSGDGRTLRIELTVPTLAAGRRGERSAAAVAPRPIS
jgi:hypothetical protein